MCVCSFFHSLSLARASWLFWASIKTITKWKWLCWADTEDDDGDNEDNNNINQHRKNSKLPKVIAMFVHDRAANYDCYINWAGSFVHSSQHAVKLKINANWNHSILCVFVFTITDRIYLIIIGMASGKRKSMQQVVTHQNHFFLFHLVSVLSHYFCLRCGCCCCFYFIQQNNNFFLTLFHSKQM